MYFKKLSESISTAVHCSFCTAVFTMGGGGGVYSGEGAFIKTAVLGGVRLFEGCVYLKGCV